VRPTRDVDGTRTVAQLRAGRSSSGSRSSFELCDTDQLSARPGRVALLQTGPALAQRDACADSASLRLFDGRIHTMDQRNTVVSEVTIQHGRFAYVGPVRNARLDPCTKSTDLHGRTAVPGLIDNHIVLLGMRPGHDVRIETTGSIAEILAILKEKAKTVSTGEWVTTLGDFNVRQFTEKRLPKLSE
jgi:imidazolonepropionase-like amidohydrolase